MTAKVNQIKVLHSLPGRVRFRLPAPAVGSGTGAGTKDMVLDLEGVLWVRLNPACCSLAVGFSPDSLSTARILAALRAHMSRSGQVRIAPLACCSRGPAHKEGQEVSPVRGAALRFAGLSLVAGWAFLRGGVLKLTVRQTLFSPLGLAVAAATLPLLKKAKQDLESRRFGLDGFLAGSILAATAMGEAVTALEILWIDSGAELLSAWIAQRSRKAISEILRISGKNTFLVVDGQEIEVPVDRVRPGDVVALHTGEKVPVDGVIVEGQALVDESPLNGRSEFMLRTRDDRVLAGTLVREGVVFVKARQVGDHTYLARIIRLVEESLENQAPIQQEADRLAVRLLKLGAALTLGTLVLTRSFWRAFTVLLVMACPCATVLSASAPISAALNAAARKRILIKGGRYLEEVGKADVVCFDKTGTLTVNEPGLEKIVNLSDLPEERLLQLAYTAEMHNFHPLALAVKNEAARRGVEPASHTVCRYQLGEGVTARTNGQSIYVGNRRFMERHGLALPGAESIAEDLERRGLTAVFLGLDDRLLGVMGFANQIRPEAGEAISRLIRDGVKHMVMITGEEGCAAQSTAERLNLDQCFHSVMPGTKARIVAGLRQPGLRVMMVGDGINDALALAEADVGVAMGRGGSEVAIEAADIALVNDDLEGLVYVRGLSKTTLRVIHQNFWIATGSNLAGVALGALGLLSPVAAGLIHIVHTAGVLANSSRLLAYRPGPLAARGTGTEGSRTAPRLPESESGEMRACGLVTA